MCVRLPQSRRRLGRFTGACVRALPPSTVNIMDTQNDVLLLTLVVRKDVGQLLSWTLLDGQPGLLPVFTVIVRLLQSQGESGGLVLGDLIIHLFHRARDSVLPVLLHAMLERMHTTQVATLLRRLRSSRKVSILCLLLHSFV
jgi:hypothetical protein